MALPSPRALDRAVEQRWPAFNKPMSLRMVLYSAAALQAIALILLVIGPPFSGAASGPVGLTLGMVLRSVHRHRHSPEREELQRIADLRASTFTWT